MSERLVNVLTVAGEPKIRIPWTIHVQAYEQYAKRFRGQDAEKIAARGGFAPNELDEFRPGWRDIIAEREIERSPR